MKKEQKGKALCMSTSTINRKTAKIDISMNIMITYMALTSNRDDLI